MNGTWKQEAHGSIYLKVVEGTDHCGIDNSGCNLDYDIYLTYKLEALDSQGFLLDNLSFRGYWTGLSTNPISISCELLAQKVAKDLIAMLGDRCKDLISVKVCLSPFNGVLISYESSGPFTTIPVHYKQDHSMIHPEVDYANTMTDDFLSQTIADDDGWKPRNMGESFGYI